MRYLLLDGFRLNPNEKLVNSITKRIKLNNGECPCNQPDVETEDKICPCKKYREEQYCCCSLYVKE